MHIWKSLEDIPSELAPSVLTLGNFDGVHKGHQQVLAQLKSVARSHDALAIAITFDPHPAVIHRPESAPQSIMSLPDRLATMEESGIDAALVLPYSLELAELTPAEFVQTVFVDALHACAVVVGHDTRFGRGNSGDVETVRQLGAHLGFDVVVVDELGLDRRWSSTWVREALAAGDVATAAEVLGRWHHVRGEVVHGAARGRELGFPTANLAADATGVIPADGIYAGWLVDGTGTRWPAAISVGSNPTFAGVDRQVEAFVMGRPQEPIGAFDLYGQEVTVQFVRRLRGMVEYTGPEALVKQMCLDVEQATEILKQVTGGEPALTESPVQG